MFGQEEVEFDLVEDISEHTEQSSFTNHVVHVDDTNEKIKEPLITENILESFDTCSVSNETYKIDNLKVGDEEVELNLSADITCYSFIDPAFQVVIF